MFMQRELHQSLKNLDTNNERLSSGQRINRSADDGAGLTVASSLQADIRANKMVLRNIEDGLTSAERAESGMSMIIGLATKMRELAVYASTETIDDSDRAILNNEYEIIRGNLDEVAEGASWNEQNLLTTNAVDMGLLVDVSGSMQTTIDNVEAAIGDVAASIEENFISLELGLAQMGDRVDSLDYTDRTADLGDPAFLTRVSEMYASGAWMDPYASILEASGVSDTTGQNDPDAFTWRSNSTGKILVMITDTGDEDNAPAHGGIGETATAAAMANSGIEVHVIGSSTSNAATNEITSATGGSFKNLGTNGTATASALQEIADDVSSRFGGKPDTQIQIGLDASDESVFSLSLPLDFTAAGIGLGGSYISDVENARIALSALDSAIEKIASMRAKLGGQYNTLLNVYSNVQNKITNDTAASSKIIDTDIAMEVSEQTNNKVRADIAQTSMSQAKDINISTVQNILS